MSYKKSEVVKSGASCPIPQNRYVIRCGKPSFGESKGSGNPQHTLPVELVCDGNGLDIIEVDGVKYNIAGVKGTVYLTYSEKNMDNVFNFFEACGHPEIDDIDPENPPDLNWLDGMLLDAIVNAEPNYARLAPKPGQQVGDIIKDAQGNNVIRGYRVNIGLNGILGISTVVAQQGASDKF